MKIIFDDGTEQEVVRVDVEVYAYTESLYGQTSACYETELLVFSNDPEGYRYNTEHPLYQKDVDFTQLYALVPVE